MKVFNYLNQEYMTINHKTALLWSIVTVSVWSYLPFYFFELTFKSFAFVVAALGALGLLFGYLVQFFVSEDKSEVNANIQNTDIVKLTALDKRVKTSHMLAISLSVVFAALWSPLILTFVENSTENLYLVSSVCIMLGLSLGYLVASMVAQVANLNIRLKSLSQ